MDLDDKVCICFHVSKRKILNYCRREKPKRVSLVSQCLSAGTGCGWCIPFIEKLHAQVIDGTVDPDIDLSSSEYEAKRAQYRSTGSRDESV